MGVAEEGVSCAACHVRDKTVLSANEPTAAGSAAHAMRQEPQLSEASFCAGCHQFPIPDRAALMDDKIEYTNKMMQSTFSEWRRSETTRVCQDCHMEQHGHLFPGAHDETLVRGALAVDFPTRDPKRVVARVRSKRVAHRVPTGDPFRRLRVRICADEACTNVVGTAQLERSFQRDSFGEDTTVPPSGEREIEIAVTQPGYYYVLDYFFGDPKLEHLLNPADVSFEIKRGRL